MLRSGVIEAFNGTPVPTMTVDPESVTPGFVGFVIIVVVVLAVIVLVADMLRRVRRARYRGEVAEQLDAELAAFRAEDAELESADADTQETGDEPPLTRD